MKVRPLSPHLTIYKPLITSVSSILGRIAGVYLYFFTIVLLYIVAINIQNSKDVGSILTAVLSFTNASTFAYVLAILFTTGSLFAFFLYMFAILRHLIWDFGYLLDLKPSKILGYLMFILSFILSVVCSIYMFFV